jgi:hypothetical protein
MLQHIANTASWTSQALAFEAAEVVSMLKASIQLLLIAVLGRIFCNKKRFKMKRKAGLQWGLQLIVLLGATLVIISDKISRSEVEKADYEDAGHVTPEVLAPSEYTPEPAPIHESTPHTLGSGLILHRMLQVNVTAAEHIEAAAATRDSWLGIILIGVAVLLGAIRNLIEEAILASHPAFPPGGLLLAESMISATRAPRSTYREGFGQEEAVGACSHPGSRELQTLCAGASSSWPSR